MKGLPDAPDAPLALTCDDLVKRGLARVVTVKVGRTSQTYTSISPEGQDLLRANQKERAEVNIRWRAQAGRRPTRWD